MTEGEALSLALKAIQHWPIISGMPQLVMHRENTVFRVETSQGAYALRLHRQDYQAPETILSELMWINMLDTQGFVVPKPAAADNGALVVSISDDRNKVQLFSLLRWLPGEPFGASASPLRHEGAKRAVIMSEIGRSLARLHVLSDAWSPPRHFTRPAWDHDGLLGDTPFWGRFWNSGFLNEEQRTDMRELHQFCTTSLTQYNAEMPDYGLIHADLARENILVDGDKVLFIDFDDSGYGYRIFDIATALIKNIYEPDYEELKQSLLAGYLAVRPLQPQDLKALPLAMLLRSLTYIGWVDARIAEPGMRQKANRFLADVEYLSKSICV
jgi:Ser/Thr protein kinase RdoA (MazF antagonist)